MANEQRPKSPSFFVDMMSYLHATGHGRFFKRREAEHITLENSEEPDGQGGGDERIYFGEKSDLLYCNTSSLVKIQFNGTSDTTFNFIDMDIETDAHLDDFPALPIDCAVVLNHNLEGMTWSLGARDTTDTTSLWSFDNCGDLVNSANPTPYNGFTIRLKDETFTTKDAKRLYFYVSNLATNIGQRYIGACFFGKSYVPKIDPEIKMSREFDGIRVKNNMGGFGQPTINHLGTPNWSGHNAWELWDYPSIQGTTTIWPMENPQSNHVATFQESPTKNLGRLGRRRWEIKFKHIGESDLFSSIEQSNWDSFDGNQQFPNREETFTETSMSNPLLEEENFLSRLWIPTLGGSIPFVFQPNTENNNPDQFAVCTIDRQSLTIVSLAPNLYQISFSISEAW
jgi:hypothetical protein